MVYFGTYLSIDTFSAREIVEKIKSEKNHARVVYRRYSNIRYTVLKPCPACPIRKYVTRVRFTGGRAFCTVLVTTTGGSDTAKTASALQYTNVCLADYILLARNIVKLEKVPSDWLYHLALDAYYVYSFLTACKASSSEDEHSLPVPPKCRKLQRTFEG
ncbi:MAG: hypothetical protein QXT64_00180 [Desulfurococcaceae archaeon]